MRTFVTTIIAVLFCMALVTPSYAGNYGLDHLKISSGKGPLSKGLGLTVDLVRGEQELTMSFDNDQGYGMWRFDKMFDGRLELLATGGLFMQTPWAGPMVKINYNDWLSSAHWVGWTAGEVENPSWETDFMFSWQEVGIDTNDFYIYYAALNYQRGHRQDLVGVTYKVTLSPNWQLRLGYDRDLYFDDDMFTWGLKFSPRG